MNYKMKTSAEYITLKAHQDFAKIGSSLFLQLVLCDTPFIRAFTDLLLLKLLSVSAVVVNL